MMRFYQVLFFFFIAASASAQEGKIIINADSRLQDVIQKHIRYNEANQAVPGFRLQIAANSSRENVLKEKSRFISLFPDVPTYLIYQQPYFKLRVGDYRTKLKAEKDLQKISVSFPGTFIVPDRVKIPEL